MLLLDPGVERKGPSPPAALREQGHRAGAPTRPHPLRWGTRLQPASRPQMHELAPRPCGTGRRAKRSESGPLGAQLASSRAQPSTRAAASGVRSRGRGTSVASPAPKSASLPQSSGRFARSSGPLCRAAPRLSGAGRRASLSTARAGLTRDAARFSDFEAPQPSLGEAMSVPHA
ncbi:hypothetical protein NDU88_003456 [Pleurodeles waltl]|uniref:Uncharacterized protein n=1 Tax=Pleurodeles waltl TaxID=8319 RepID=A0AAV7P9M1_PLEWA|nr:hypothetical protein NDU88_003456 [Pleurodeles waltl]